MVFVEYIQVHFLSLMMNLKMTSVIILKLQHQKCVCDLLNSSLLPVFGDAIGNVLSKAVDLVKLDDKRKTTTTIYERIFSCNARKFILT